MPDAPEFHKSLKPKAPKHSSAKNVLPRELSPTAAAQM